jgi:membrane associated rhomboid family serine protease
MPLEASLSLVEKLSKGSSEGVESVNLQEYTRAEGHRLTHAEILHIIMASMFLTVQIVTISSKLTLNRQVIQE